MFFATKEENVCVNSIMKAVINEILILYEYHSFRGGTAHASSFDSPVSIVALQV